MDVHPHKALGLNLAGSHYSGRYVLTGFGRAFLTGQFIIRNWGDFYVQIDAVEQRARNFGQVAFHHSGAAHALFVRVVVIATRARIHRRHQHKTRRVVYRVFGPRNGHAAFFHRLAHHFQNASFELGQLIQKKHPIVRQGDFAGHRIGASSHQGHVADGMVWGTKRPGSDQSSIGSQNPRHGMDFGGFQRFLQTERG